MEGFLKEGGDLLFHIDAVSSAQSGLTSLFGMERGEPRRCNHLSFMTFQVETCLCHPALAAGKYLNIKEKGILESKQFCNTLKNQRVALPPCGGRSVYISLRVISTTRLRTLPHFHLWPINVVVSHDPLKKSHLVVGFALICFQRLSLPDVATQQCSWRNNWYTRGQSNSVLSY